VAPGDSDERADADAHHFGKAPPRAEVAAKVYQDNPKASGFFFSQGKAWLGVLGRALSLPGSGRSD
jgi:hypothetical protein